MICHPLPFPQHTTFYASEYRSNKHSQFVPLHNSDKLPPMTHSHRTPNTTSTRAECPLYASSPSPLSHQLLGNFHRAACRRGIGRSNRTACPQRSFQRDRSLVVC